jgi:hypothetical protein
LIGGFRKFLPNQNPYQFQAFFATLQMIDFSLVEYRFFRDYFAEPAIGDVFGLHVLFSFSGPFES